MSLSIIILLSSFVLLEVLELKPLWAQSVIKTLDVGYTPFGLKYNPNNDYINVTNSNSDSVSLISSATNTVIKTIDVGDRPN